MYKVKKCSFTAVGVFLVLALCFLGLTDIRWRAAEVSRQRVTWTGELKSNGSSTAEEEEFEETERGKGRDGDRGPDLMGAGLGRGESGRDNGLDVA